MNLPRIQDETYSRDSFIKGEQSQDFIVLGRCILKNVGCSLCWNGIKKKLNQSTNQNKKPQTKIQQDGSQRNRVIDKAAISRSGEVEGSGEGIVHELPAENK